MSTKTTFKRIALVTVAALGFGVLTSVAPATALPAKSIALNASSMTIVQNGSETPVAVVRIDVASTDGLGLGNNETITAEVTGVPSGVVTKTLNGNGGLFSAANNDLRMVEVAGQTANLASVWDKYIANAAAVDGVHFADTPTSRGVNTVDDGKIDRFNTMYAGMDGNDTTTAGTATTDTPTLQSHYVAIFPKAGKSVIDFGAYTISFRVTDAQNNQVGSVVTLTLDFVSTSVRSGAVLSLTTAGTFTTTETVGSTTAKNATLTIKNRDNGVIRSGYGAPVTPTMSLLDSLGRVVTATGSGTAVIVALDNGDDGSAGTHNTDSGTGLYNGNNGTFGVTWDAARYTWDADGNTIRAAYGATAATAAITTFAAATGYTSDATVTATGSIATSTTATTLPLTTKAATVTVRVLNGTVAVQDYPVRFTTTWSTGTPAGDVLPVSGTTGSTLVRTNSSGLATLSLSHANPADGASASVAILVGGATTATITEVLTWTKSKPAAIAVDPAGPMTVALKSANKVTFTVVDTFSKPVVGEVVQLTVTGSNNTTASPLLIPSATTDANGQVSYTLTDALAIAAGTDTIRATATSVTGVTNALVLTYATTVPVASSMKVYYDAAEATWNTLVPATVIYETASTATGFTLNQGKDITASLVPSPKTGTDDVVGFNATVLTSALAGASGLPVTVSISDGGWILNSAGLPVTSRTFYTSSTGVTGLINVTATTPGVKTLTFTVGTVSSTASVAFTNKIDGSTGRYVTVTEGANNATATANASKLPSFTAKVTDNLGNPVAGAALNIVTTGVARLATGGKTAQWTTDASGEYVFELTSSDAGAATVTVTATTAGQFSDSANFIAGTEVVGTKAGVRSATGTVTFAEGTNAAEANAQAATDAAAEATDAANAATDAANAAAEAADAATAAAQDAADAVAALSTQVATYISNLRKQITALTNLVIKIQKKVNA